MIWSWCKAPSPARCGMGTSSNNNLDQFTSKMMVLELPYLIRSPGAYRKFWQTASGDIRRDFETKLGLKILMVMDAGGFRGIETKAATVRCPERSERPQAAGGQHTH